MHSAEFGSLLASNWGKAADRIHSRSTFLDNVGSCCDAIFNGVSNGITVCDATLPELPLIYVNPAFEAMTGYPTDELCGRNCRFLQGPDRDQAGLVELRAAIRESRSTSVLLRNYRRNGTLFWNQLYLSPVADASGKLTFFIGIQNDVTEKVQSDVLAAQISRSQLEDQAWYRATFDSLSDGLIVFDSKKNLLLRANSAAVKLFGIDSETSDYRQTLNDLDFYLPNGDPLPHDQWPSARAERGDYVTDFEMIVRRKDGGASVVVLATAVPLSAEIGAQVVITYKDITHSRSSENIRARYAAIVEFSNDAIIGKDLNGIITDWNGGAERLFGYSSAEIIGQSIRCLLPPNRKEEEDDILRRIRLGQVVEHIETERMTKAGHMIHISATISPIRDSTGRVIGASKIAWDISEKRLLERQLRQSQKMEALGQATGGIAHDFNNLLGVIIGNLDLLERSVSENERALKRIRTAKRGAARGANLTRRLLAFSSQEELKPVATDLAHSIRNVMELSIHSIGPQIAFKTQFDLSLPPVVVDAPAFENALLNIVINARDAMPNGGIISIITEFRAVDRRNIPVRAGDLEPGGYACVSVSDNGTGMSKEVQDRAFEPFFTTKSRQKGTGLGLSMVYGFARQSGGVARIYSEPGFGTTVSCYLPLEAGPGKQVVEAPDVVSRHLRNGGSVLVVDDEEDLVEIAVAYIEEMGLTAYEAHDATSALKLLQEHRDIALVITDIIMPGTMNGIELGRNIRRDYSGTRIIYSSGFPAAALADRNIPIVDGPLLRKPYQRSEFRNIVRDVLETGSIPDDL